MSKYRRTDKRLFQLTYDPSNRFIYRHGVRFEQPIVPKESIIAELWLCQAELLRMLRSMRGRVEEDTWRRIEKFLVKCDFADGGETDFVRKMPRGSTEERRWRPN